MSYKDPLTGEEVRQLRAFCDNHKFIGGKVTNEEFPHKKNLQSNMQDTAAQQASALVQNALTRNQWVHEICVPKSLASPMISKYTPGMEYGEHVDTHLVAGNPPVRVDVSCTVFLNDPAAYDGGELVIRTADKTIKIKEQAGDAILYPSTQFHHVAPVTRGERLAAITFIQSHIRDAQQRSILYELQDFLHQSGGKLSADEIMKLEYVRTNLLRMWYED